MNVALNTITLTISHEVASGITLSHNVISGITLSHKVISCITLVHKVISCISLVHKVISGITLSHRVVGADPGFCAERREARKLLGYFVWKITILRKNIIFFPILGGGRAPGAAPPPLDPPLSCIYIWEYSKWHCSYLKQIQIHILRKVLSVITPFI